MRRKLIGVVGTLAVAGALALPAAAPAGNGQEGGCHGDTVASLKAIFGSMQAAADFITGGDLGLLQQQVNSQTCV